MSYPIVYEVRDGKVFMVCREIPGLAGVVAELEIPDELVAAWLAEEPEHCESCGARLVQVGEQSWCGECTLRLAPPEDDGTFWG